MKLEVLTGRRFGRLEVQNLFGLYPTRWGVLCDCGNTSVVSSGNLKRGNTKSCGCFRVDLAKSRVVHGHSVARESTYLIWKGIRQRCWNPNSVCFKNYGAKGVEICPTWWWFPQFLSDMGPRPEGLSIERLDPRGNYSKQNCVWATSAEQSNNKRNSLRLSLGGETKTATQWAADPRCRVGVATFVNRIQQGWSLADALFSPVLRNGNDPNKFSKTLVLE